MTDESDARLTVVCTDGTTIDCTNFKAIKSGILLTEDVKKNRVCGFVPNETLRFVLPTEQARTILADEATEAAEAEFEDSLMRLPGLGGTYAKRLRDAGYTSLADISAADSATLADVTGARETQTTKWVEQATAETDDGERVVADESPDADRDETDEE